MFTTTSLEELTTPRNILFSAFTRAEITLASPLKDHVAWAHKHIYSIPYPSESKEGLALLYHGIQHVTRAALYALIWINLYRAFGNQEALALTEEDIKLIQIALIFHDAARLNDGEDLWDKESAGLFYYYLLKVLAVEETKATKFAQAIAQKDDKEGNIIQYIIHDADCLDILRARPHFEASYLKFHQTIAVNNPLAFELMSKVICEARSIIECQGDGFRRINIQTKQLYENENAHDVILKTFSQTQFAIPPLGSPHPQNYYVVFPTFMTIQPVEKLQTLCEGFLPSDDKKTISSDHPKNFIARVQQGKVFARSINTPAACYKKKTYDEKGNFLERERSLAAEEIYKIGRGSAWSGRKKKTTLKLGDPDRSVTLLGPGAAVYGNSGFLTSVNIEQVRQISAIDIGSGRGKKRRQPCLLSTEEKQKKLDELFCLQKMGGKSTSFSFINPDEHYATHNEVLIDILEVETIYFSPDPNYYNLNSYGRPHPLHLYTSILEAIFLQREYQKWHGKKLPIFEYSGLHNYIIFRKYSENDIIKMWVEICKIYMQEEIDKNNYTALSDIEKIKLYSMYLRPRVQPRDLIFKPADSNYAPAFRKKITDAIQEEKAALLLAKEKRIRERLLGTNVSFDKEIYTGVEQFPTLLIDEKINLIITNFIKEQKPSENTLQEHWINENSTITRLYFLAKATKNSDFAIHLQSIILNWIDKKIENTDSGFLLACFRDILETAGLFEITAEAKRRIIEAATKYFTLPEKEISIQEFRILSDFLLEKKFFTQTHFDLMYKLCKELESKEIESQASRSNYRREEFEFSRQEKFFQYLLFIADLNKFQPGSFLIEKQIAILASYKIAGFPTYMIECMVENSFFENEVFFQRYIEEASEAPSSVSLFSLLAA